MENNIANKILSEVGLIKSETVAISKEVSYLKANMVTKSELHSVINAAIEESEHRLLTFMQDELATKKEVQALRGEFLGSR